MAGPPWAIPIAVPMIFAATGGAALLDPADCLRGAHPFRTGELSTSVDTTVYGR
jgi:hypothetical protein